MDLLSNPAALVKLVRKMPRRQRKTLAQTPTLKPIEDGAELLISVNIDPNSASQMADWLTTLLPGLALPDALAYVVCALAAFPVKMLRLPTAALDKILAPMFAFARENA